MTPNNRHEAYLAAIAGDPVQYPEKPLTREEAYLDRIAKNGSGGGGSSLPAGGTAGQLLTKKTNADGDAEWKTLLPSNIGEHGVAELDETGRVPSSHLPSYVDDVIEGYLYNGKWYSDDQYTEEVPGESGKIYVDLETNKEYRWSGTQFVEISASLALGETSSTAFAGNRGKAIEDIINTLGTASTKDVPTSGNASSGQVVMGNDSRLTDSRPASDVSAWAKAATKPTYTASEVDAIATSAKGVANGVASLGADGKVPTSQLPASSAPSPYASDPAMDGTASAGSSNDYARGDHVHPSDTSKLGVNDKAVSASVADAVEKSLTITSDAFNKTYNGSGAATISFVRLTNDLLASGWSATTDSQGYFTIAQGGARIDGATGRVQLQPGQSQDVIDAYNAIASIDVDGSYGVITAKTKVKPSVNIPIYIIGIQMS